MFALPVANIGLAGNHIRDEVFVRHLLKVLQNRYMHLMGRTIVC